MTQTSPALQRTSAAGREAIHSADYLLRQGILKLLAIEDSDTRILTLEQSRVAVDKSLHAWGAFSAVILAALYYGGFISPDVIDPTRVGSDLFVLSEGHGVAAVASIYAELSYFDASVLKNSRSYASILNGHPGSILAGIQRATKLRAGDLERVIAIYTLDAHGRPRFIHSGTYEELVEAFGLSAAQLARKVMELAARGPNA